MLCVILFLPPFRTLMNDHAFHEFVGDFRKDASQVRNAGMNDLVMKSVDPDGPLDQ